MAAKSADSGDVQEIRRLASDMSKVRVASAVELSLLAHHLTKADICDAIVDLIDAGERVKPTTLHSFAGLQGQPAFEMKPRLNNTLFYIKVTLIHLHQTDERMLLISAHPDYS
jgi:hypothetical protein